MKMTRRSLLGATLAGGLLTALSRPAFAAAATAGGAVSPLPMPKNGTIDVAFVISNGANVIDLAGPWEAFQDASPANGDSPFRLCTIAETTEIVEMTGGLRMEPTHSFDGLHFIPNVIVVGAQSIHSERFAKILRDAQGKADVTMSVCTGAFNLAQSGILDGRSATTHHEYYDAFAKQFPKVNLVRGPRFVDDGAIVTAGGLTSGIAAALHVIARYLGPSVAGDTARYMEFVNTPRPQ